MLVTVNLPASSVVAWAGRPLPPTGVRITRAFGSGLPSNVTTPDTADTDGPHPHMEATAHAAKAPVSRLIASRYQHPLEKVRIRCWLWTSGNGNRSGRSSPSGR